MISLPKLNAQTPTDAQRPWLEPIEQAAKQVQYDALRAYYRAFEMDQETPLTHAPLLALDFETTGLNPEQDDIISIGAVPMSTQRIYLGQSRYWVLKPASKLRADTIPIHGITHSDIVDAPDLIDVLPDLLNLMKNRIVVAHCASIETQFFSAALQYRIGEGIVFPAVDTMGIERKFSNRQAPGLFARMFRKTQGQSLRLADVRGQYGLPFYRPHNALLDALACAELLQAQVQHHALEQHPLNDVLTWR
mgnify:CR=1 FL=1